MEFKKKKTERKRKKDYHTIVRMHFRVELGGNDRPLWHN